MNESKGRWAAVFLFLALAVVAALGIRTIGNSDFWDHLAAGQWMSANGMLRADPFSFTREGEPVVDSSWLYDRLLYGIWSAGGFPLVIITHAVMAVAAFLLLLPVGRRVGGRVSLSLALLLSAWLLAPALSIRPVIFCLPFPALFILALSRRRSLWTTMPVLLAAQILWANLSASFVLGPVLAFLYALEAWWQGRASRSLEGLQASARRRSFLLALLTAVLLAAGLATPYGTLSYQQALTAWSNPALEFAAEWISPFSSQFPPHPVRWVFYLSLAVGALGLVAEKRKLPLTLTALMILGLLLTMKSPIHSYWLAILGFPFFCLSVRACGELVLDRVSAFRGAPERLRGLAAAAGAALAVLSLAAVVTNRFYVATGSASAFGLGAAEGLFPDTAAAMIRTPGFPDRAINPPLTGGYLAFAFPQRKVFVDHRADLYGRELFTELFQCMNGQDPVCQAIEDRWKPGAVILSCSWPGAGAMAANLLAGQRWKMAWFDGATAILLRPADPLRTDARLRTEALGILESERAAYEARLGGVVRPPIPSRLVGAGNLFMALQMFPEAEAVFSLLAQGAPRMATAWLSLGICQVETGRFDAAEAALREAVRLTPGNALGWLWLGLACSQSGQAREADFASGKARAISPGLADAFHAEMSRRRAR